MEPMLFCAQLSGLSLTAMSVAMLARRNGMIVMVERLLENPPVTYVLGLVELIAGFGITLTQSTSSCATLPLVLTFVGWWLIIRGGMLMFLTQDALWSLVDSVELPKYHLASNLVGLVIGGYLTYVGFTGILGLHPIVSM